MYSLIGKAEMWYSLSFINTWSVTDEIKVSGEDGHMQICLC